MKKALSQNSTSAHNTTCGKIAIIGRSNVGKSTLLNKILAEKVSITARKPQTTRHRILGIKTTADKQMIYVDTPGIYHSTSKINKRALNRRMLEAALSSIHDVEVIIFVAEALRWTDDDEWLLQKLKNSKSPIILTINKVDEIKDKSLLLSHIEELQKKATFVEIVPVSAKQNTNVKNLESVVGSLLPNNAFLFPADQITDHNDRFFVTEIIREKLIRLLGQEVPYSIDVQIEKFKDEEKLLSINALIIVEKIGQKAIVIGTKGQKLKEVGTKARLDLERHFEKKVFLELWVKVKENWADNTKLLDSYGY